MPSVLIGDDLTFALNMLETMLKEIGILNIIKATDAVEVIRAFKMTNPDLIIVDIKGMNGFYEEEGRHIDIFDAIKIIKSLKPASKIIVITATPEEKFVRKAIKEHINGFLVKGYTKEKLKETINKVLKSYI